MDKIRAFAATMLAFLTLDVAWLLLFSGGLFKSQLGPLLRSQPNLAAAAAFYLIYVVGMVVLVVLPALSYRSVHTAIWRGVVLGLTAYATFDLTNLAIISGWTLTVSLVDMAWGTTATALACLAGYYAGLSATLTDRPRG